MDNLTRVDRLLMLNSRIYISLELRAEALNKLNSGNQVIVKKTGRTIESVWWPGINKEIKGMVESCNTCMKYQRIQHKMMMPSNNQSLRANGMQYL